MGPSRNIVRRALMALVLTCAMAGPALAANEESHESPEKIEIFKPAIDLGIWTLVVFGVLLVVLKKYAWGPMLQGLHTREERIQGSINEAQRLRDEAEGLRKQFQQQMDRAQEKVRDIM